MKNLLLAATALIASASLAFAADLPQRQVAPALYSAAAFSWAGFYVGAQADYAWGDSTGGAYYRSTGAINGIGALDPDGFFGGLHAGYNYQFSNIVVGVEIDGNYAGINGSLDRLHDGAGALKPVGNYAKAEMDWNGSARLHFGYAFDRIMPFITGGVALANYKFTPTYLGTGTLSNSSTHVGWTIGAGVDYAITNNFIAGVEYRYSDYGKEKYDLPGFPLYESRIDLKTHDVRLRLGYKF
jgi:outer membrane immunogenic protein